MVLAYSYSYSFQQVTQKGTDNLLEIDEVTVHARPHHYVDGVDGHSAAQILVPAWECGGEVTWKYCVVVEMEVDDAGAVEVLRPARLLSLS